MDCLFVHVADRACGLAPAVLGRGAPVADSPSLEGLGPESIGAGDVSQPLRSARGGIRPPPLLLALLTYEKQLSR